MTEKVDLPVFTFTFDGKPVTAHPGETVAAALLANSINITRTTAKGSPRGPYCMMGACYDCLVDIDGATHQACMLAAEPDLVICRARQFTDD